MRTYILQIIISSITSAVICSVFDNKKAHGKIIRILTGILMTVTVLSPLKTLSFYGVSDFFQQISADGQAYVEMGKTATQTNTAAIIKEHTEAYILDKASNMGLDVAVEVELNENNSVPCGITVSGEFSPYEKGVLSDYIEEMLGIAREHQIWK